MKRRDLATMYCYGVDFGRVHCFPVFKKVKEFKNGKTILENIFWVHHDDQLLYVDKLIPRFETYSDLVHEFRKSYYNAVKKKKEWKKIK
jgi:hypothetical protein